MATRTHISRILWLEAIGFSLIIVLSWIDELTDLPHFVGAAQYIQNWREGVLETLTVLLVAIPVMIITKRIVSRLYYLEGFLRVCGWCKKLDHNGEWIPLEEFFDLNFQTKTSHGICTACADEVKVTKPNPAASR
jgi:hypothetical protein